MKALILKTSHLLRIILVFIALSLSACGGGGSSSDDSDDNNFDDTNNTDDSLPIISGFDISLREGDWWEYEWDY